MLLIVIYWTNNCTGQGQGQINILVTFIMKKYEKVNLSSQIYRQKTPTKSPINLKPVEFTQSNTFSKSFHSVCCPNCRYLFKIPKENERPKTPTNEPKIIGNGKSEKKKQVNIEVQTQQYLLGNFRTSPKKERMGKEEGFTRGLLTDRTPDRLPYFQQDPQHRRSPNFTDRRLDQRDRTESQLATSRRQTSNNRSNQKISELAKQNRPEFPTKSAYLRPNTDTQKRSQALPSMYSASQQSQAQPQPQYTSPAKSPPPKAATTQAQAQTEQVKNTLAHELVQKIQLGEQINEIIQYHMNLPPELSVPSYCKMLIYDIEDRRLREKKNNQQQQELAQSPGRSNQSLSSLNRALNY